MKRPVIDGRRRCCRCKTLTPLADLRDRQKYCRGCNLARGAAYRIRHREAVRARATAWAKVFRQKCPERVSAAKARYRERHRDSIRAYDRLWCAKNKKRKLSLQAKSRARVRARDLIGSRLKEAEKQRLVSCKLLNCYVRKVIAKAAKLPLREVPTSVLDAAREHLLLTRALKELGSVIKNGPSLPPNQVPIIASVK